MKTNHLSEIQNKIQTVRMNFQNNSNDIENILNGLDFVCEGCIDENAIKQLMKTLSDRINTLNQQEKNLQDIMNNLKQYLVTNKNKKNEKRKLSNEQ